MRAAGVAKQAWLILLVPLLAIFFLSDGRVFSATLLKTRPSLRKSRAAALAESARLAWRLPPRAFRNAPHNS